MPSDNDPAADVEWRSKLAEQCGRTLAAEHQRDEARAERDRLKAELADLIHDIERYQTNLSTCEQEVDRLNAELARLRNPPQQHDKLVAAAESARFILHEVLVALDGSASGEERG